MTERAWNRKHFYFSQLGKSYWHLMSETKDGANLPGCTGQVPATERNPARNADRAELRNLPLHPALMMLLLHEVLGNHLASFPAE